MLKIKLSKTGKKNQSRYRIIVSEAKSKRDGKFVENLGYYISHTSPSQLQLDRDRYQYWLQKGAQPTATVRSLADKVESSKLTNLPINQKSKNNKKTKPTN